MTDASLPNAVVSGRKESAAAFPWRSFLLVIAVASAISGFIASSPEAVSQAISDPELTMLLRFMAGVKALLLLASLALLTWRLGHPTTTPLAVAYVTSAALMSASIGLIWQLAYIGAGALAFHAGLLLLLGAGCADRGAIAAQAGTAIARLRRASVA